MVDKQNETPTNSTGVRDASASGVVFHERDAMIEGLTARVRGVKANSERGQQFASAGLPELARYCVERSGVNAGMDFSPANIVRRAFETTSDFPSLLLGSAERLVEAGYSESESELKRVSRTTTLNDFRRKTFIQISSFSDLEKVNEAGEFKHGTLPTSEESLGISTVGITYALTRQAIINDDFDAFSELSNKLGKAAARYEGDRLAGALISAQEMSDGNALFHPAHGNLAPTGSSLSVESLSEARIAMSRQTDAAGRQIYVRPKFLVVPVTLQTPAEQLLSIVQATTTQETNPFAGKLELVVEPRLEDDNAWYLAADPAQISSLRHCYLRGHEKPFTEQRVGWEVDGVEWKIRHDFGAGWSNWRGWWKNPGG